MLSSRSYRNRVVQVAVSATWALGFVAAATLLTLGLQQIAIRVYFILFVPAVIFSTWFGGGLAGVLSSALTVIATLLLLPRAEVVEQLAWVIVAAIVVSGISALTAARRRAEETLSASHVEERALRQDAEAISQLKTDLLAEVAHELRQPLGAITAAARLLETERGEAARQRALGVIVRQSNHLRELVDDLLDLSKLTRRQLQLRTTRFDLCEIVDDTVHVISDELTARGLSLSTSLTECPLQVQADPTRVRQILSNLLSNAVKFTEPGGSIELAIDRSAAHVTIRVRDTGRGIPSERLPYIFDMFQKGDTEGTGLGIGLAVVKGLAELHGGFVEARSPGPGRGSEFTVSLPVFAGPAAD